MNPPVLLGIGNVFLLPTILCSSSSVASKYFFLFPLDISYKWFDAVNLFISYYP